MTDSDQTGINIPGAIHCPACGMTARRALMTAYGCDACPRFLEPFIEPWGVAEVRLPSADDQADKADVESLKKALAVAVANERYEEAARIRDHLNLRPEERIQIKQLNEKMRKAIAEERYGDAQEAKDMIDKVRG